MLSASMKEAVQALTEKAGRILNEGGCVEEQWALRGFIDGVLLRGRDAQALLKNPYKPCYMLGYRAAMNVEDVDVPDEEEE